MDLFQPGPGYTTFEDAEVLFGIDIKGLLVDRCAVIWMGFAGGHSTVDVVRGYLVGVDVVEDVGGVSGR